MSNKIILRIILALCMAISVIMGWWFVSIVIGIIGLLTLPSYIELILAGLTYDSLYGFVPTLGWRQYAGTFISIILTIIIVITKRATR